METISAPLKDAEYLLRLSGPNYYTQGGEPQGVWFGEGSAVLGRQGLVDPKELRRLFRGLSPDGRRRLVMNAGSSDRIGGWDLTFSAPKSVSVIWALSGEAKRRILEQCHDQAVRAALTRLEAWAVWTRRGQGSKVRERAKAIFALFQHGTSRTQDPDLHTHCLLINLAFREKDGTTGSLVVREFFRLKILGGLLYRQELASALRSRLGLKLEAERNWFEVSGVPKPLLEAFSQRRRQVLAQLAKMGRDDAVSAAAANKATRLGKEETPRVELFARWAAQAWRDHAFGPDQIRALLGQARPDRAPLGLHQVVDQLLQDRSYFTGRELLRGVLEANQARGQSVATILRAVRRVLPNLVNLGVHQGEAYYTSRRMLQEEQLLLEQAEAGRQDQRHTLPARVTERPAKALSAEQRQALLHLVCRPGDLQILQGLAGTGKSTLLAAARQTWEKAGFKVVGAAYSGKAAEGLQESSGINAQTVDRLLFQWAKAESRVPRLTARTVLVVDEAGMLGTLKLGRLLREVRRARAKLILVGDDKQLPPIEAGAPFAELGRRLGRAELKEIRRQKNPLLKFIVQELADGQPARALRLMKHDRLLRLSEDEAGARRELIQDWLKAENPERTLILAGTREQVRRLNEEAQAALARGGRLGRCLFRLGETDFRRGDRVVFGRNDRLLGVLNGNVGVLRSFAEGRATIDLTNGRRVYVPVVSYGALHLGYALTTHRAQGATVDRTYVLWSEKLQSREMTYVQASRSRHLTRFYLTKDQGGEDFLEALRLMERRVSKKMAVSLAREAGLETERARELSPSL